MQMLLGQRMKREAPVRLTIRVGGKVEQFFVPSLAWASEQSTAMRLARGCGRLTGAHRSELHFTSPDAYDAFRAILVQDPRVTCFYTS